jgi:hypothetical protein
LHIEKIPDLNTSQQHENSEEISEDKMVEACRMYERQEMLSKVYSKNVKQ